MLQKLPKFLKVAKKTGSCPKVAEQLVDRAKASSAAEKRVLHELQNNMPTSLPLAMLNHYKSMLCDVPPAFICFQTCFDLRILILRYS